MTYQIIDGKKVAEEVRAELKQLGEEMQASHGVTPGIAVILVGERPDSATYVRMKKKAAAEVGFISREKLLPDTCSEEEVLAAVSRFNADPEVHGILVQLPLPPHISEQKVLGRIMIEKDVDGFDPANIGALALKGVEPKAISCTPYGVIELLRRYKIEMAGKNAVVVGRSNIVGMPVALLLIHENATVTVCHSKTKDLPEVVRRADIVVAAIGRAKFIKGDWVKEGAVVIDVGINSVEDSTKKSGYRLVGDVDYDEVKEHCSYITPVPGGVGPMTIAMLLKNTPVIGVRHFADSRAMSKSAEEALQSIKEAREKAHKLKLNAMSKKERRKFPGNFMNFKLGGGRPEFYHIERNQNGRIFEPDHVFEIVVYGTKNNCQATVINKSWNRRTVSLTNAGRVGIRKCKRKGNKTAERIGQSVAKKMRRLGVTCADLRFRYLMRQSSIFIMAVLRVC
ncbi:Neuropathy target esterase [Perkinsus chesapeaki]|uniref:Neuropathy target esterase n=1 Tax=Perkinsus chesapeaki TaxID=330153 RepID=A0A7J6LW12_PERCH|nr:Neuropathy target esterase [Perkinsus chesapeaki]